MIRKSVATVGAGPVRRIERGIHVQKTSIVTCPCGPVGPELLLGGRAGCGPGWDREEDFGPCKSPLITSNTAR